MYILITYHILNPKTIITFLTSSTNCVWYSNRARPSCTKSHFSKLFTFINSPFHASNIFLIKIVFILFIYRFCWHLSPVQNQFQIVPPHTPPPHPCRATRPKTMLRNHVCCAPKFILRSVFPRVTVCVCARALVCATHHRIIYCSVVDTNPQKKNYKTHKTNTIRAKQHQHQQLPHLVQRNRRLQQRPATASPTTALPLQAADQ